jgi:hypothetical protein
MAPFKLPPTNQEIFDIVAKHLLTQNEKSIRKNSNTRTQGVCAYRGDNGCKCAAGVLIPDEHYLKDMEGHSWFRLISKDLVPSEFQHLIRALQSLHDNCDVSDWKKELKDLATSHNLEWKFS